MKTNLTQHFQTTAQILEYVKRHRREFIPDKLKMSARDPQCGTNYAPALRVVVAQLTHEEKRELARRPSVSGRRFAGWLKENASSTQENAQ